MTTPKKNRKPVPDIDLADLTHRDTETDRMIQVVLEIPFYGRKEQAHKFVDETLGRILAVGIGSHVKITDYNIETP